MSRSNNGPRRSTGRRAATRDACWCHVWQHQHGGTDYMSEALIAQKFGDGYDWKKGDTDYTAALRAALADIKAGRGAP